MSHASAADHASDPSPPRKARELPRLLITPQYRKVLEADHEQSPQWGATAGKFAANIRELCENLQTRDVIDYGCGKCALGKALGFPIQEYDPGIPAKAQIPEPADIVACIDVLEHIEPQCVGTVLRHILELTKRAGFLVISTARAAHILPNGKNAHLSVHPADWWLEQLTLEGFENVTPLRLPQFAPRYEDVALVVTYGTRNVS